MRKSVSLAAAVLFAAASSAFVVADTRFSKADSDAFHRKLELIIQQSGSPATAGAKSRQTPISERELNAYLQIELRDQVPTGVTEPTVTILGDGKLVGSAVVDLDAVRTARTSSSSSSWFDPVRLLSGRMPVTASGVLQTQQGTGRFLLESAEIAGVPVPKAVLQQVVSHYTVSSVNPNGVSLDDAFELPARIREIRVQPGQAIVVQ